MADHLQLKGDPKVLKALLSNSAANDTIMWSCSVTKARAWHDMCTAHGMRTAECARHVHTCDAAAGAHGKCTAFGM